MGQTSRRTRPTLLGISCRTPLRFSLSFCFSSSALAEEQTFGLPNGNRPALSGHLEERGTLYFPSSLCIGSIRTYPYSAAISNISRISSHIFCPWLQNRGPLNVATTQTLLLMRPISRPVSPTLPPPRAAKQPPLDIILEERRVVCEPPAAAYWRTGLPHFGLQKASHLLASHSPLPVHHSCFTFLLRPNQLSRSPIPNFSSPRQVSSRSGFPRC